MKKYKLTLEQLKNLFISGGIFEKESIEMDMTERDEITALDFGEYIEQVLNIKIE